MGHSGQQGAVWLQNCRAAPHLQHHLPYIANALGAQWIGLEKTDDGVWSIYFIIVLLATLDEGRCHPRLTPHKCYRCRQTTSLPISLTVQVIRGGLAISPPADPVPRRDH
jgi:hypothetical protein